MPRRWHGRRLACLLYCASYTLTCLTMFSNDFTILFLGRVTNPAS